MKKQILILIVALFAISVSTAFGQGAVPGFAPIPVNCTSGPMNPIAGVPYPYEVTAAPAAGQYQWWATKDPNFISTAAGVTTNNMSTMLTTPVDLTAVSASYGSTSGTNNVTITWSSATLAGTTVANPTFVAVQYDAPAAGCANNLKVFKITPVFAFTVDITNVEDASGTTLNYGDAESQCVGKTLSAVFNPAAGVGGEMEMDYGYDTLYFEVIAANFSGFWTPSFQLDGLLVGQAAVIDWSYSTAYTPDHSYPSQNGTGATLTYGDLTPVNVDPSVTTTAAGVSIFVRVIVHNLHHENLGGQTFTLHVEGTDATGTPDIENTTCLPPAATYEDLAAQLVNPRPTVAPVAPGVFVPQTTP